MVRLHAPPHFQVHVHSLPGTDDGSQFFGRSRSGNMPVPEATVHPLLLNTANNQRSSTHHGRGSRHHTQRIVTGAAGSEELIQQLEEVMGPGSGQFFQHLIAQGAAGFFPDGFRLEVPGAALVNLNRSAFGGLRRGQAFSASIRVERAPRPSSHRHGREFEPLPTVQRWIEETKILHGDFVNERIGKLVNHVILALLPAAIEAAKEAKLREEEEAARIAAEKEKEEAKKREEAEAEAKAKAEAEASISETMDAEPTSTPPAAPAIVEQQEVKAPEAQPITESRPPPNAPETAERADQVMAEASNADAADAEMADVEDSNQEGPSTETDGSPQAASSSQPQPEASASAVPERVTVMIHGSPVDITDTGIDPDFLAALPDDMREEVLNQHVRDQRAARIERPADSQISSEFLDALPPDIRAEILQQEALERERRRAEENAAASRGPAEIDPASFIASLDPTLRQTVLMEQDEGFIASLPSHMLAEVEEYRGPPGPRRHLATRSAPANSRIPPQAQPPKPRPQHDAIQLLDKAGIATLVRLLFFPQVLRKTLLFKVLVNLCENSKTRTELFNLLLSILQDGTGDLAAVDKSFAQMSVRSTKPQTPKSVGKQKLGPDYLSSLALPTSQMEAFPDLIAQKCLDALSYIVTSNESASLFFLTEHELPAGLRKSSTKKGKGKEKQAPQSHYPIVLLLGLLDRQSLLRTPAIMESVVGLLAIVTRPLTSLKDAKPPVSISGPSIAGATQPTEASAAPPSETPPATATAPVPGGQTSSTEDPVQQGELFCVLLSASLLILL